MPRQVSGLTDNEMGTEGPSCGSGLLEAMPPEGVARCRAAWARLAGCQTCVVHGDADARDIAAQASAAWEAAVCRDDDYAVRRLAEVRAVWALLKCISTY